jgi:hypothetical protein
MGRHRQPLFEILVRACVSRLLDYGVRCDIRHTTARHNFIVKYPRRRMGLRRVHLAFSADFVQNGVDEQGNFLIEKFFQVQKSYTIITKNSENAVVC